MSRQELLQKWNIEKPEVAGDGALLLRPASGPYDALLVWFDKDKVARVVARQRQEGEKGNPSQWSKAVSEVWTQEGAGYGWPRRMDVAAHNEVQGLGWHDDEKQIHVFWREDADGAAHVYREWRSLNTH
jgi:hypothetical protein